MSLTKEDMQAIEQLLDKKLDPIKTDICELKADVSELKADVSILKEDVNELKADMQEVKERVTNIELLQENQILPNIRLLAEGHTGLVERLDGFEEMREKVDDIHFTNEALKLLAENTG